MLLNSLYTMCVCVIGSKGRMLRHERIQLLFDDDDHFFHAHHLIN